MCVKFYFIRSCRTHKNFQLFVKWLLKIFFFLQNFLFFGSLKSRDIFLPSMKFSFAIIRFYTKMCVQMLKNCSNKFNISKNLKKYKLNMNLFITNYSAVAIVIENKFFVQDFFFFWFTQI